MTLTLFEAIRELKEGQEIRFRLDGDWILIARLDWGSKGIPTLVNCGGSDWLNREVTIFNLPPPQPTLYDVLVDGATSKRIRCSDINYSCAACKYHGDDCTEIDCSTALIDTLCDIAFSAGFDLKKIAAGEGEVTT